MLQKKMNTYTIVCLFNSANESLNLVFAIQLMWIQSRKLNRTLFTLPKFNLLNCKILYYFQWFLWTMTLSLWIVDFLRQFIFMRLKIIAEKIKCFRIIVLCRNYMKNQSEWNTYKFSKNHKFAQLFIRYQLFSYSRRKYVGLWMFVD